MYVSCIFKIFLSLVLLFFMIYLPIILKENFTFGYPWYDTKRNNIRLWDNWNRPWVKNPYYINYCPRGCVYSGYESNNTNGYKCFDPSASCPVGVSWCCQYDRDCNSC